MEIIETSLFTRLVVEHFTDEEYRQLQEELRGRPDLGNLIPGGGGIRKLRWGIGGRGKRGGARLIYYWATAKDQILMLMLYAKNEMIDLHPDQLKAMRNYVEENYR